MRQTCRNKKTSELVSQNAWQQVVSQLIYSLCTRLDWMLLRSTSVFITPTAMVFEHFNFSSCFSPYSANHCQLNSWHDQRPLPAHCTQAEGECRGHRAVGEEAGLWKAHLFWWIRRPGAVCSGCEWTWLSLWVKRDLQTKGRAIEVVSKWIWMCCCTG